MVTERHNVALVLTGDAKILDQVLKKQTRNLKRFEAQAKGTAGRIKRLRFGGIAGGARRGAGRAARIGAGLIGGFGFATFFNDTLKFERTLTRLQIKGEKSFAWTVGARKQILAVSDATGKSKEEVLSYVDTFTTLTGDVDSAISVLKDMGDVALATGTKMGDLAGLNEKLAGSMKITGKETRKALNILASQEKLGSVPLAALAQHGGRVFSQASLFGKAGQGLGAVKGLGGLFQLSARGFGAGQEAQVARNVGIFLKNLAKARATKGGRKQLGKLGIDVSDENLSLTEIFKRVGTGVAGNKKLFAGGLGQKLFAEGARTALQLGSAAQVGFGGKVGKGASFNQLFERAGEKDVIGADLAKIKKSPAQQFDEAINKMKNTIQKSMLPVLKAATKLMPIFGKALQFILENSELLIKLWLGVKGALFFSKLLKPGGAAAGAGVGAAGAPVPGAPGAAAAPVSKARMGAGFALMAAALVPALISAFNKAASAIAAGAAAKGKFDKDVGRLEAKARGRGDVRELARLALLKKGALKKGLGPLGIFTPGAGGVQEGLVLSDLERAERLGGGGKGAKAAELVSDAGEKLGFESGANPAILAARRRRAARREARIAVLGKSRGITAEGLIETPVGKVLEKSGLLKGNVIKTSTALGKGTIEDSLEFFGKALRQLGAEAGKRGVSVGELQGGTQVQSIFERLKEIQADVKKGGKIPITINLSVPVQIKDSPGSRAAANAGAGPTVSISQGATASSVVIAE